MGANNLNYIAKRQPLPLPLWGGVRGGGRDIYGVSACRNRANDQHSPNPTPSASRPTLPTGGRVWALKT